MDINGLAEVKNQKRVQIVRQELSMKKKLPNKTKARLMVRYAINEGKLIRLPCEKCGEKEGIHAHHPDYSKPLDVLWLCPKHHKEWHKKNGYPVGKSMYKALMVSKETHYKITTGAIKAEMTVTEYIKSLIKK